VLEDALESGAIALVDAHWLMEYAKQNSSTHTHGEDKESQPISRRQDLPPQEAFVSCQNVKLLTQTKVRLSGLRIVALSYMWLHPDHPDPNGFTTLQLLAQALRVFIEDEWRFGEREPRWVVLWDYVSLFQHPRTSQETVLFRKGLDSLAAFFTHPHTYVFKITKHPPNYPQGYGLPDVANTAPYERRGWPSTEASLADLNKKGEKIADLSWAQTNFRGIDDVFGTFGAKRPPFSLPQFERRVAQCSFTNQFDDLPLVSRIYRKGFETVFAKTITSMEFARVNWGDDEVIQLAEVFEYGELPHLTRLDLSAGRIGPQGCHALSRALSKVENTPELILVSLSFNRKIGDLGCLAMTACLGRFETIHLADVGLTDDGCCIFVEALLRNYNSYLASLVHLDVGCLNNHNQIGLQGFRALQNLFTHWPKLEKITIGRNPVWFEMKDHFDSRGQYHRRCP